MASFSWTTWVSRYQKGKTSLDLNKARDDEVWGSSSVSRTIAEVLSFHVNNRAYDKCSVGLSCRLIIKKQSTASSLVAQFAESVLIQHTANVNSIP